MANSRRERSSCPAYRFQGHVPGQCKTQGTGLIAIGVAPARLFWPPYGNHMRLSTSAAEKCQRCIFVEKWKEMLPSYATVACIIGWAKQSFPRVELGGFCCINGRTLSANQWCAMTPPSASSGCDLPVAKGCYRFVHLLYSGQLSLGSGAQWTATIQCYERKRSPVCPTL